MFGVGQETQVLRPGTGCSCVVGVFALSTMIVDFTQSLKATLRVVFLKPPLEGLVQCGWSRSIKGLQKVKYLAVFLKPPWAGEVGAVRVSMWECAARLGTLHFKIPSLSDVT